MFHTVAFIRSVFNTIWCGGAYRVVICVMIVLTVGEFGLPQGVMLFDDGVDVRRMLRRRNVNLVFLFGLVVSLQLVIVMSLPDLVVRL